MNTSLHAAKMRNRKHSEDENYIIYAALGFFLIMLVPFIIAMIVKIIL